MTGWNKQPRRQKSKGGKLTITSFWFLIDQFWDYFYTQVNNLINRNKAGFLLDNGETKNNLANIPFLSN